MGLLNFCKKEKYKRESLKESILSELKDCVFKSAIDIRDVTPNTASKIFNILFGETNSAFTSIVIKLSSIQNIDLGKIHAWQKEYNDFVIRATNESSNYEWTAFSVSLNKKSELSFRKLLSEHNANISKLSALISEQFKNDCYNPVEGNVFLVHGHNLDIRNYIAKKLKKDGLNPVILDNEVETGVTVLEKFIKHAKTSSKAIIFMTKDDEIVKIDGNYYQARPNVFIELGYFLAIMERKNIIIVKQDDVCIPSDIGGIIYETYSGDKNKLYNRLIKNLKN